jgi:putative transcriptional regulator
MTEVGPGTLLVATPALLDPNFADSVVLLIDADEEGALGVILNRPSSILVADVVAGWSDVCADPEVLFQGGPVSPDGAIALAALADGPADPTSDPASHPLGFRAVAGRLGLMDLDTPLELVAGSLGDLRIFAGYAGWGADQLRQEVAEGAWYVLPSVPGDVFRTDTTTLWRDVLRRQPGALAWHSTRPCDPDLN